MKERRVLQERESLSDLMVNAAKKAIENTNINIDQIDRLYGYGSVAEFITPNVLYKVHRDLGLSPSVMVIPIHSDFSNYPLSLIQAWEGISAGHSRYALVVTGGHFTKYGDYTAGHSLSLGDGAGAVVVGPSNRFVIKDYISETWSHEYGYMTIQNRQKWENDMLTPVIDEQNRPIPTFGIDQGEGVQSFLNTGMEAPPRMILKFLERNGISGKQITMISHQASRKLIDYWASLIQPREYFHTFEEFGNMALASASVTAARLQEHINTEYLLVHSLGLGFHHTAVLLRTTE
jgi:3-oxoacyl-[acyl-carrier-protein] synthase III